MRLHTLILSESITFYQNCLQKGMNYQNRLLFELIVFYYVVES